MNMGIIKKLLNTQLIVIYFDNFAAQLNIRKESMLRHVPIMNLMI